MLGEESFGFCPKSLEKHLTPQNIIEKQKMDEKLQKVLNCIEKGEDIGKYFLNKGVLCKKTQSCCEAVVIPRALVPFVVASYHFQTHGGPKKLLALIQLRYVWGGMI